MLTLHCFVVVYVLTSDDRKTDIKIVQRRPIRISLRGSSRYKEVDLCQTWIACSVSTFLLLGSFWLKLQCHSSFSVFRPWLVGKRNLVLESKARTFLIEMRYRIIHGRAEIWNFSLSVQLDISRVSAVNEISTELNTRPNLKTLANFFFSSFCPIPFSSSRAIDDRNWIQFT